MEHALKILPHFFSEVYRGNKKFEIRKNDRSFKVSDTLILQEWDGGFTGNCVRAKITYILDDNTYLQDGYIALGIEREVMV